MRDRIADNAIDFGAGVHLIDAVGALQFLCGDLSGRGFFAGGECAESEDLFPRGRQDAADNTLLAHAQTDERMVVDGASRNFIMVTLS